MTKALQISLLVYGILVSLGGIFGFLKAKSKASLIAGLISGGILITAYSVALRNPKTGFMIGAFTCTALIAVFAIRLSKTKKFMPSGMLLILTAIEEFLLFIGVFVPLE